MKRIVARFLVAGLLVSSGSVVTAGAMGLLLAASGGHTQVDLTQYPGYDRVCDTGTVERRMDGGKQVRYWGPNARTPDCFEKGEDVFRRVLTKAPYVTPEKLASMKVPPGAWVVQIQPGFFVSTIPYDERERYAR